MSRPTTWRLRGWTWRHSVVALSLMAGGVAATWASWRDIVEIARRDQEQSHVFLAPLVAAWLFWVRRERLRGYTPHSTWVGPAIVAVGWLLYYFGEQRLVEAAWHVGAILVVVGGLVAVTGGGVLRRFLPVFLALLFLVPVPGWVRQSIAIPLQRATASVTQTVLETFGAAVERSGSVLRINQQDVLIAEACNGLRMVFALVMVSFAFAYGTPLRRGFRALVLVASPLTAIVFNVLRLVPTVWAFGWLPVAVAEGLHDVSGWLMLPFALLVLVGVMRLLRWAQIPVTPYVLAHGA